MTFLESIYALCSTNTSKSTNDAIDLTLDTLDILFQESKWEEADTILKEVDVKKLNLSTLFSFITYSSHAKEFLPSRNAFVGRAYASVAQDDPDRVNILRYIV